MKKWEILQFKDCIKSLSIPTVKKGKKTYLNISCSFDIETTSTEYNNEKVSFMYLWVFGINGMTFYGRTWDEFIILVKTLNKLLLLSTDRILVCYVHNLSFEFQFFRKLFNWEKVFAIDDRKVCYCLSDLGVEFRCSYILSGYSLAKLAEHLTVFKAQKMVGDLDYKLVRTSETPLSEVELNYAKWDVLIVMFYIQEKLMRDENIVKIPLTKTSYVRNYCRKQCFWDNNSHKRSSKFNDYRNLMKNLTLTKDEYLLAKEAFQGGFTHASAFKSNRVYENVGSIDFTSSYPFVMVAEKFPMSRGEQYEIKSSEDFKKQIRSYCCLFRITLTNLDCKVFQDHPLSLSKCRNVKNALVDNGRIISADYLETTVTDIDFIVLLNFYTWSKCEISNFWRYMRGYLPTNLVKSILELYKSKTELKGVSGKEIEYMASKENINSVYG